jgi:glutathione S-transferase
LLPESAVICEYLEDRHPDHPLLPLDPGERAAVRLLVFRFPELEKPYYAVRRGDDSAAPALAAALGWLDAMLSAMPYLSGRAFGLADVAYLPWVIRARDLLGVDVDATADLAAWLQRVGERPSVAAELDIVSTLVR